jgi:histidinol-phosphate aminotransferase
MARVIRTRRALEAIPSYVPGRSAEAVAAEHGITNVVKLASNEAPFGPLPAARAAIADAIAGLNRYPDDRSAALTEAIAVHYGVDVSQVLLGAGSVDLCRLAFAATVEPGGEVLFAWPSFEMYPILALQAGGAAVRVPLRSHVHDLDGMTDALSERTRLVFVCNPNNPTSTAIDHASMTRFLAQVPSHCLVVLDEAYREFVTSPDFADGLDVLAANENVAVLRTFSKAYGLAALRVGYAIAHPEVIDVLRKVAMPFRVNALAQVAALASLGADGEMRDRVAGVVAERARLADALRELGFSIPPSEANFVWLDVADDAAALGAFSERQGVVLRVFSGLGVRITVGTPDENERVVRVLRAAIDESVVGRHE